MTPWKALFLISAAALAAMTPTPIGAAHADPTGTFAAAPMADAWYGDSASCPTLPAGCGSAPTVTSYPDHTLHVGATGGQEAARSYLRFAANLPEDARITAGQLVLPVDPGAGTNAPETAALTACLVPGGLPDPAPSSPPSIDCTAATPGSYLAGSPAVFLFDLGPLLARTHGGALTVAIVPTPTTASAALTTTWHVALSSRKRTGSTVPPPTANLDVDRPDAATGPVATPNPSPPLIPAPLANQPVIPTVVAPLPVAPVAVPPPPVVTNVSPRTRVAPAALTIRAGRYGSIWALPLLLVIIGYAICSIGGRDLRSFAPPTDFR